MPQGVTTGVVGNCGISLAPVSMNTRPRRQLDLIGDGSWGSLGSFGDYDERLDSDPAPRVVGGRLLASANGQARLRRARTRKTAAPAASVAQPKTSAGPPELTTKKIQPAHASTGGSGYHVTLNGATGPSQQGGVAIYQASSIAGGGGALTVTASSLHGNTATVSGSASSGSRDNGGGAIFDTAQDMTLIHTTAEPGNTATVSATASSVQASSNLQVLPLSAHPRNLTFRWVSLWYHTVREGTWDYMVVQSTLQTQLGVWAHVIFPNGQHWDFYTATDNNGRWSVRFNVPARSVTAHSNQAYVTFQLWHGNQTTQSFMNFTLV